MGDRSPGFERAMRAMHRLRQRFCDVSVGAIALQLQKALFHYETRPMTLRETAIAKLHQLPESLLQEVTDFIDFVTYKHQSGATQSESQSDASKKWANWFESVDQLNIDPIAPDSTFQQLLLNKYRQQGLDL